jgi:hypothetical protein
MRGSAGWALIVAGVGVLLLYYSLGMAYNNVGRVRVAIALAASGLSGVVGALAAAASISEDATKLGSSVSRGIVGVIALLLNVAVCVAGVAVALFLRW